MKEFDEILVETLYNRAESEQNVANRLYEGRSSDESYYIAAVTAQVLRNVAGALEQAKNIDSEKPYGIGLWQFSDETDWTHVVLNSPYGAYNHGGSGTKIPNGTRGYVEGKINPTRGNEVVFFKYEHLDNVKVPSHWLTVMGKDDG